MTDESTATAAVPAPASKRAGGWPKGKPRTRATPVAREPIREAKAPQMRARPNWENMDDHDDSIDRYHIPREMIPDGMDLQWVTNTVYGQVQPQYRTQMERKGWTPVHSSDFDGRFDGMFLPKGYKGELDNGGQVLMVRPLALSQKSRARERQAALDPVRVKEAQLRGGDLPGVDPAASRHPSALRQNQINRSRESIAVDHLKVPED